MIDVVGGDAVHRLAAAARRRRAGCSSSASPPARASPRSRSTGCCSTTSTSAASAGAPTRWPGPATCSSSGPTLLPMMESRRGRARRSARRTTSTDFGQALQRHGGAPHARQVGRPTCADLTALTGGAVRVGAREHPRRRPRGHEPRHPAPGRPVRPRQRPLARRDRDPRRPVQLGPVRAAGRRRRGAGARRSSRTLRRAGAATRPRRRRHARSATSSPRFMDEEAIDALGARARSGRSSTRSPALRDVRDLAAFLGEFERIGGARPVRRPTSTPTTATPTATSSTSSRAASACPTSPTTARTSSPRSARSTSPTSTTAARPRRARRPGRRRARPCSASRPGWPQGHWERAETRDVHQDLQPDDLRRAHGAAARPSTGTPTSATSAATTETLAEVCVRQPSYLAHLSTVLDEVADRAVEGRGC